MLNSRFFGAFAILAGALLCSSPTWAAGGEVSGFGGGIRVGETGIGGHGLFGGAGGIQIGEHGLAFGEFTYAPLGSLLGVSLHQTTYGGGYDQSFGSSTKVVPYGVVFVGGASATGSASATGVGSFSVTSNAFDFGFGGGVRVYVGKNWGLKPEFRYERVQVSGGGDNDLKYTVGVFYRFGKK